jgi:hypothetical protein
MAEIVNFNKASKARDKAKAREQAAENRAKFGRTRAEKEAAARLSTTIERHLDGHKRDLVDD